MMHGQPGSLLKKRELTIDLGWPLPAIAIQVGFTNASPSRGPNAADMEAELRPSGPRSGYPEMFDTGPYQERYRTLGATAYELMLGFIRECVDDRASRVHVFAFDIDHPDIIRQFIALGSRLTILLDDSPIHAKQLQSIELLLKDAKCDVRRFHFKRYSHNKAIIRSVNGKPVAVLTGSANFSIKSLFAQSNHVVIIHNEAVAAAYERYFQYATTAPTGRLPEQMVAPLQGTSGVRVLFTPSQQSTPVNVLVDAILRAKSSILFSLGGDAAPIVFESLRKRKSNEVFVAGVVHGDQTQIVWDREETIRKTPNSGPSNVNGKFVVIDFNEPGAVVFAGSSNFAIGSSLLNGDNVVAIQDSDVAAQFAIQALQMVYSYRFRALASRQPTRPFQLVPNNKWLDRYFTPGTIQSQERRLLIGAAAVDAHLAASSAATKPTTKKKPAAKRKGTKKSSSAAGSSSRSVPGAKSSRAKVKKRKLK